MRALSLPALLFLLGCSLLSALDDKSPTNSARPPETASRLAGVKKLCVSEIEGYGQQWPQARETIISGLFGMKRFAITERCDKADAILKGAVTERGTQRSRSEREGVNFGVSGGSGSDRGSLRAGDSESLYSSETGTRAVVSLRIVDLEGEVLWAHTEESAGGKLKGALGDAIERAIRTLARELEKSDKKR